MSDNNRSIVEKALQEAEDMPSFLLNKLPDPIFIFSREGQCLYVNDNFSQRMGKKKEEIIGRTIDKVFDISIEDAKNIFYDMYEVFQNGREKVIETYTKDDNGGSYYITTITPITDEQEIVTKVICISKDITDRKSRETEAKENEEKYKAFFSTCKDSVFISTVEGKFLDINESFVETFGYENRVEVMKLKIGDLYAINGEREKHLAVIDKLGSVKDYPVDMRRKDGSIMHTIYNTVVRKDSNGKIIGYQGTIQDITPQKIAEEALRKSETQFRLLVDHSYDLIWNLTAEGVFTYVSPSWQRVMGYLPEEVIGKNMSLFIHPDDLHICQEHLQNSILTKKNQTNIEYRTRHKDGSWYWHSASGIPVTDQNNNFYSFVGISRNINEQKIAEEMLLHSEENFRLLVSQMKQGLSVHEVITDENNKVKDYRFLYVNEYFESMTGLIGEEIIGKTVLEIMPETEDYWIEKYGQVALTGEPLYYQNYSKEIGKYFSVTAYSPKPRQFAVIATDITERVDIERKMFEEKELLKITLLSVGDGVITTDREGRVTLLNKVAEKMTGWAREEAFGKPFEEIFYIVNENTQERCESPHIKVLQNGKTIELSNHTILITKEGNAVPIEDTAAPIRDGEGNINGMVLVFRDCSERRKRQQRIEFLSFRDSLTGLYNRRFFEEELKRMNVKRNLPISLVIADVNGLKLANDAFGHAAGDMLLQKAAKIMRKECRADDVIARIGGDEFVILLPKTDSEQASLIVKRMNENMAKEKMLGNGMPPSFILSISFGWDTKHNEREDMAAVFKRAEDNMYRRKLSESTSMRSETIRVIIKTLYEKSEREQQHSVEVSQICQAIGEALELSIESINELRTVGLMHDIGKIILNDYILDKPGPLTDSEWFDIKRHSETGYRILESVKEFSQMAEYVLTHHERWDGKGYPKGLKGEEIPLQARIIAIADSYNAMVSDRAYRKALSKDYAKKEIMNNAGIQFDPLIANVFIEKVLNK